jgi:hypothetical protein
MVPLVEYTDQNVINLALRFDGPAIFRYETDSGKREERQAASGETINLSTMGWVRVWTTNGGKTNMRIGTRELKAGADGEIAAWSLQWASAANNTRQLQLVPMY